MLSSSCQRSPISWSPFLLTQSVVGSIKDDYTGRSRCGWSHPNVNEPLPCSHARTRHHPTQASFRRTRSKQKKQLVKAKMPCKIIDREELLPARATPKWDGQMCRKITRPPPPQKGEWRKGTRASPTGEESKNNDRITKAAFSSGHIHLHTLVRVPFTFCTCVFLLSPSRPPTPPNLAEMPVMRRDGCPPLQSQTLTHHTPTHSHAQLVT